MYLPKEYPFIHVYAQQKPRQPVIIKANTFMVVCAIECHSNSVVYRRRHRLPREQRYSRGFRRRCRSL
ncbi:hypothetical protein [uncultured Nostoc sp.]|uniref:hypothetical protein n=1 Tax=uncultured Nostoc sp. TaxID=340711 RepID=UPI0035CC900B